MGMTEYEDEPVEGLPDFLPEGETMVWQGRPTVAAMARRVFFIPPLALYFGLLIAGHTVYRLMEGVSAAQVMGTFVLAGRPRCHCAGFTSLVGEVLCGFGDVYPY